MAITDPMPVDPPVWPAFDPDPDAGTGSRGGPYRLDGPGSADWAMRKLGQARAAIAARRAEHQAWMDEVDERVAQLATWLADVIRDDVATADRMTGLLSEYAMRERRETGRATLKLPSGEVATKATGARLSIIDLAGFTLWAQEHMPAAIAPEPEPKPWTPIAQISRVDASALHMTLWQVLGLECGHTVDVEVPADTVVEWVEMPATAPCPDCRAEGRDDADVARVVDQCSWRRFVVDEAGEEVPGLTFGLATVEVKGISTS
jgi:hypothetical protein